MRTFTDDQLTRALHGPGPSPVAPTVLQALGRPVLGHLDPTFLQIMDDLSQGLRQLFRTANRMTFPVSGTGSAGMEAAVVNLIEPGDTIVIGVNGVFGGRMAEEARRAGAKVEIVEAEWGGALPLGELAARASAIDAKVVGLVHAETSTGVEQPLAELRSLLGDTPLLLVDSVTGLGGSQLEVDAWGIDVCYSGSQKCLSVPPGLAPITFSDRAVAAVQARETPVQSWYLDTTLLSAYWDDSAGSRAYHHTAPISMIYALHEGVRLILDEGLEAGWGRHQNVGTYLQAGLLERGFDMVAPVDVRLSQLTATLLPSDIDDATARNRLLFEHGIEIGGGLGALAGKAWRIGMMGYGATIDAADRVLGAIDAIR
ncbi:MAG: alanine--glyoxylate aminotransferase family protein [Acidimicrobiia bacterium]|nr:alanine--glyoxylate aminotransferase family protein [Acidimicrobiia bacterium]